MHLKLALYKVILLLLFNEDNTNHFNCEKRQSNEVARPGVCCTVKLFLNGYIERRVDDRVCLAPITLLILSTCYPKYYSMVIPGRQTLPSLVIGTELPAKNHIQWFRLLEQIVMAHPREWASILPSPHMFLEI